MSPTSVDLPATYRAADGARVEFADALPVWTPLAYEELLTTAASYGGVVTYKELGEHVQEASGIRTRSLLTNWMVKLLEAVANLAKSKGAPPLTSLCVRQDGTVRPGYAQAPRSVIDEPGEDIELYAAQHRLLCYREFARDLPADGGRPALTLLESARRQRVAAQTPVVRAMCPIHFTEISALGRCDSCD
jgi:hypothetical protein